MAGQSISAPTITLADVKAKIAAIEREVVAGGGSQEYRDCLDLKYKWARRARYMKEHYGPFEGGRATTSTSAMTLLSVRACPPGPGRSRTRSKGEGDTAPAWAGDFPITDGSAELFRTKWPGVADTVRPLPTGEYRFYYSYRPKEYIICDGEPEEEKKREEVFVTVTAPAGTVYEAFFDPSAGAAGVPVPSELTVRGGTRAVQRLEWSDGAVVLHLFPYADLAGHTLDFIALDGTTALSLDAGDASVDHSAGTLTWPVATQPWREGDQLMLRLRKSSAVATPER